MDASPQPGPPSTHERGSSWLQRRARARQDRRRAEARRGESLRAEARRRGRAAADGAASAGAPAGLGPAVPAELASWAAVTAGRAGRAHGPDRLPPAPDDYELGHARAGLVLGAVVLCGGLLACDLAADRGQIGLALLILLLGVLGGPATFLALALPKLFDPRVQYWSRELAAEALRAAQEQAARRHLEAPGLRPADGGRARPR
ncbi:hypothetical protein FHN55_05780 [Streptomyces sp. NP160]|uniref:hypothetical protein n=1 Tax=Streptomyces sp. NP160 TaxID=2586637 RepID=UPI00111BBCCE|nr:hypothetical protein [Streptomyces sp. NP160]TNM68726.1 hypothetical protein FHN55_05780 [Streptomyces sp. NP160]